MAIAPSLCPQQTALQPNNLEGATPSRAARNPQTPPRFSLAFVFARPLPRLTINGAPRTTGTAKAHHRCSLLDVIQSFTKIAGWIHERIHLAHVWWNSYKCQYNNAALCLKKLHSKFWIRWTSSNASANQENLKVDDHIHTECIKMKVTQQNF